MDEIARLQAELAHEKEQSHLQYERMRDSIKLFTDAGKRVSEDEIEWDLDKLTDAYVDYLETPVKIYDGDGLITEEQSINLMNALIQKRNPN